MLIYLYFTPVLSFSFTFLPCRKFPPPPRLTFTCSNCHFLVPFSYRFPPSPPPIPILYPFTKSESFFTVLGVLLHHENVCRRFLRNVCVYLPRYTASLRSELRILQNLGLLRFCKIKATDKFQIIFLYCAIYLQISVNISSDANDGGSA
jgi:hypothetical protein